jgi:tetratricopeptide (TPR) repeat protein
MIGLQRCLDAAHGFITLGMFQDAWDELENLPPEFRSNDVVLALRIEIFQGLKKWESCRVLAESLAKRSPENPDWWLSWSFALRREQSVEAAQVVLRKAAELHPSVALIAYNLACYACVLGEIAEAKELLKRAVVMDEAFKKMALDDPDLDAIFGPIKTVP